MKRQLSLILLISLVIGSCNIFGEHIDGNGNIKTENRAVDHFTGIDVGRNMRVHVTQSDGYAVRIETDENLMEYITVRTNGDILEIETRDNTDLKPSKNVDIYVSAPELKVFRASGASVISNENKLSSKDRVDIGASGASHVALELNAPKVDVDLSGASEVRLKGETRDFIINASGASQVRCYDLLTENVDVDASGSSSAEVFASVHIKAGLSGASNVRYKGNATVDQNTSGASSVRRSN